jgi:adenylate cyclase
MVLMNNRSSTPAVQAQLKRLLKSDTFRSRRRPRDFLRFIVEATLADHDQRLKAYTIGLEVFGYDPSFDPSDNAIVRVQASRLRQLLDDYYRQEGARDQVIISLPKGSYVPVFTLTETSSEADAVLADGISDIPSAVPVLSVADAVNLTGEAERDYFCQGLTLELKNQLIRQHYLPVATGDESITTTPAVFTIAGHVRGSGQRLRVTIMLQQTATGSGLGTQEFECRLSDTNPLDKQQNIAVRAAAGFAGPHGVLCRRMRLTNASSTPEAAALAAFRNYCERLSVTSHAQAKQALQQAAALATTGADTWAALAQMYIAEHGFGYRYGYDHADKPLERARDAARQALILNPTGAAANTARALVHYHRGEHASFLSAVDDCLALDSCHRVDVLATLGMYLVYSGYWERGMALLDDETRNRVLSRRA